MGSHFWPFIHCDNTRIGYLKSNLLAVQCYTSSLTMQSRLKVIVNGCGPFFKARSSNDKRHPGAPKRRFKNQLKTSHHPAVESIQTPGKQKGGEEKDRKGKKRQYKGKHFLSRASLALLTAAEIVPFPTWPPESCRVSWSQRMKQTQTRGAYRQQRWLNSVRLFHFRGGEEKD